MESSIKHKFSIHDIYFDQFFLFFRKYVYPYEYMVDCKIINESSLPKKEDFHSHLNMEDITDANYKHEKGVCKDFEIKTLGEYHGLYAESDRLLLTNVFNNFCYIWLERYGLDLARVCSAPGLA